MKAFRKIRNLVERLYPTPLPPESPEQAEKRIAAIIAAEQAAQRERTEKERVAYTKRLAPFVGRLFLMTDFGPFEGGWEQHTARTVDALGSAGIGPDVLVGTSVHLSSTRGMEGQDWQLDTQDHITTELKNRGYQAVLLPRTEHYDLVDSLLRTVTSAAENTARDADRQHQPDTFGHVAVVEAVSVRELGVWGIPENGSLFVLQDADVERGRLSWQMIAADPAYHP